MASGLRLQCTATIATNAITKNRSAPHSQRSDASCTRHQKVLYFAAKPGSRKAHKRQFRTSRSANAQCIPESNRPGSFSLSNELHARLTS